MRLARILATVIEAARILATVIVAMALFATGYEVR
jgi:hypothetical protein